jgi:hypothetical protein
VELTEGTVELVVLMGPWGLVFSSLLALYICKKIIVGISVTKSPETGHKFTSKMNEKA